MTKPALAAVVALALSLPLANLSANAQGSSASVNAESRSQTQSTTHVQTTFSAPQQASRSRAATVGSAPSTWQTTTTSRGTTQTLVPAPPATPRISTTATTSAAAPTAAPAAKTADDSIIVTQSTPRISAGTGTAPNWQKFYEYVKLKQGQDTIPLTLTVTNGSADRNHPPFQNINMFLNGQKLASEKDFRGNTLSLKMDGTLTSGGNNQLLFQAYGPPNASLSWKLTTQRAVITAVTPDSFGPGDTIKISGRNFSNKVGVTQVWVGEKIAQLKSGNAKTLQAVVPDGVVGGESKLQVAVAGIAAKPFKVTVKANAPELTGTDLYGCPPGTEVTLSGKGFSTKPEENVVTVSGVQAQVVSANATTIRFLMPELPNIWAAVPVSVKTKNVASKNTVNVQPSNRLLPNTYQ